MQRLPKREDTPIRVLHVVGGMNCGGIDTWLMHVLRRIDRERFRFEFLVHSPDPGHYDEEILALGGRILYCPGVSRPWEYALRFTELVQANGPYDIVHSHVYLFSGYVLWLAALAGIPNRIAHIHTTKDGKGNGPPRRLYRWLMLNLVRKYTTAGLGASQRAVAALFGPHWETGSRFRVLPCAIDLEPYAHLPPRGAVRRSLGIAEEALLVGHVGRFDPPKNHSFLLEVAACILNRRADTWFLLAGDGPLRPQMEQKAHSLGISERIIFAGVRADVPALMAAMDAFLLPSLWEGGPIVLIEAQAAGLSCVASDAVAEEAILVPDAVRRMPLTAGASEWAEALLEHVVEQDHICRRKALEKVMASDFNLQTALPKLLELYLG
jgi:glycosyltransferase involved in cell wall biosynthesis